jgi:GNAT superfamily N-acetyltransferase
VDVFGNLQLNLHENPEALGDSSLDRLVDVAQSAFDKEGQPTEEDVVEHIVPASTFITAEVDGEIVGFSSTDTLADTTYAVGLAVEEDYQNQGIGKLARTYGVLQEMDEMDTVSTRTQNPAVLGYMQDLFNAYPREDEEAPEEVSESLERVAGALDPEAEFEGGVMREAYPEAMYDEVPDHGLKEFTDKVLDYENGDALIAAGEVSREEVEEAYNEMADSRSYDVSVTGGDLP